MANKDILELVFKHSGGVELRAIEAGSSIDLDTVVWASDSDQDFMDEFPTEIFDPDEDAEKIMDYLIEADVIDDDEADELRIVSEALDGRDIDPGDDDDDDEDDDDLDAADREVQRLYG